MTGLKQIADIDFPTKWAHFRLLAFESASATVIPSRENSDTAVALVLGNIHDAAPVVRIHSQCITGDVFHSLRCDCHDQLHQALGAIATARTGILIYEQQEGRGIGLMEKLKAYELQDQGLDTIEANVRLGHPVDSRDYKLAVRILHHLGVRSLRLITNNPAKIRAVQSSGITIVERIGADVPINPYCADYLSTKRQKLGHIYNPPRETCDREAI